MVRAFTLLWLVGCAAPRPEPAEGSPPVSAGDDVAISEPATEAPPEESRVWFAVRLPVDVDGEEHLTFVVLDETRGAGDAAAGELVTVADHEDLDVRVSTRAVDAGRLDPELRALAARRWVALGGECEGPLGDVVELVLDGHYDASVTQAVALAAPMDGCEGEILAAHPEGAPPAHVFEHQDEERVDDALRERLTAAAVATAWYAERQAQRTREWGEDAEEMGPWHAEYDVMVSAWRAADGRTVYVLALGGRDWPASVIVEESPEGPIVRGIRDGDPGLSRRLLLDIAGDGTIERVDREGLVREEERLRTFVRGPYIPGC